jgi:hypothetical protein
MYLGVKPRGSALRKILKSPPRVPGLYFFKHIPGGEIFLGKNFKKIVTRFSRFSQEIPIDEHNILAVDDEFRDILYPAMHTQNLLYWLYKEIYYLYQNGRRPR